MKRYFHLFVLIIEISFIYRYFIFLLILCSLFSSESTFICVVWLRFFLIHVYVFFHFGRIAIVSLFTVTILNDMLFDCPINNKLSYPSRHWSGTFREHCLTGITVESYCLIQVANLHWFSFGKLSVKRNTKSDLPVVINSLLFILLYNFKMCRSEEK